MWSSAATTTSDSDYLIWQGWNQAAAPARQRISDLPQRGPSLEPRIREINEQSQRAAKAAAEAVDRARRLLVSALSKEQRAQFERDGYFVVHGRSARYRIRQARSANIDVIDRKGFVSHRLCAHTVDWIPDFDTMLTQKLMLEHDEADFLGVANRHSAFEARGVAVLPALS